LGECRIGGGPVSSNFGLGRRLHSCLPGLLDISDDGRYLAAGDNEGGWVEVFDLTTGKRIGYCPNANVPRFLGGGHTLVTFASEWRTPSGSVKWYACEEGKVLSLATKAAVAWESAWVVGFSDRAVLLGRSGNSELESLFALLPASWAPVARSWFGWGSDTFVVDVMDLDSGEVADTLKPGLGKFAILNVSADGRQLAMPSGRQVTIWDIPPRRPLYCWLTCGGLALLAAWVGWPRKGKVAAAA
jgi:hypothetical protein